MLISAVRPVWRCIVSALPWCFAQSVPDHPTPNVSADDWLEMQRKFESYEQQLVTLSVSNAKLCEENDNLR